MNLCSTSDIPARSACVPARRVRRPAGQGCDSRFRSAGRRPGQASRLCYPIEMLALLSAVLLICCALPISAAAPDAAAQPPAGAISPEQLSQSIDQVLQKSEFAWRMPREKQAESGTPKNWLVRMLQAFSDMIHEAVKAVGRTLRAVLRWIADMLYKLWPHRVSSPSGLSSWSAGLIYSLQILLLVLIAVLAGLLGVLIFRAFQRRRRPAVLLAEATPARPDLSDENVGADQLPEDGWLKLAREMVEDGNLRLALRAFYLAGLAHLAAREMISIAVFKSNREYEAELRRRARAQSEVQDAFSQNVAVFDWAWYGLHEVTQDALVQFQFNLARIRAC